MTHTLRKPTSRMTMSSYAHEYADRMPRLATQSDPADLAEALRTLAIRAHHAMKTAQSSVDESTREELHRVRTAIRWLEDEFKTQQLDRILPYVVSLRHQVESSLI